MTLWSVIEMTLIIAAVSVALTALYVVAQSFMD